MKIKLALSKYWKDQKEKIPMDSEHWNPFNGSFENKEIDPDLFPVFVQKGYSYTAQHRNYRKKENFICSQFLALDFDKSNCDFDSLLQNEFISSYANFLHTTPSHTTDNPRTRVVFILDNLINDSELYGEMAAALVDYFKLSDNSCKDSGRFFYGSKDCDIHKLGHILPISVFNEMILTHYRVVKENALKRELERLEGIKVVKPDNIPERFLQTHRTKLLNHIENAADGQKHLTILTICTTLGGYVASGYYDFHETLNYCKNAIVANSNNVKDLNHAFDTIEKSLNYGMSKPLYFEDRFKTRVDNIKPELLPEQKEQVHREFFEVYYEAMTANDLSRWQELGFNDTILQMYGFGFKKEHVNHTTGEKLENAFTVPYKDIDGKLLNVEYRSNGNVVYEYDLPFLFETDYDRKDCQMVVLPDSLVALKSYLMLGECEYNFVGLPQMPIFRDTIEYDGAIVFVEPDTDIRLYNLLSVRDHCRFLRLPLNMDEMLKYDFTPKLLKEYIKMSKKL